MPVAPETLIDDLNVSTRIKNATCKAGLLTAADVFTKIATLHRLPDLGAKSVAELRAAVGLPPAKAAAVTWPILTHARRTIETISKKGYSADDIDDFLALLIDGLMLDDSTADIESRVKSICDRGKNFRSAGYR